MKPRKILLTKSHVNESLSSHIIIGSDNSHDCKNKRFTFQPLTGEYFVFVDGKMISHGTILETLLEEYNDA